MQTSKLNVYSPKEPGEQGYIIGDKRGLITLKRALERALDEGVPIMIDLYTNKGEDCPVVVAMADQGFDGKLKSPFVEYPYEDDDGLNPKEACSEIFLS